MNAKYAFNVLFIIRQPDEINQIFKKKDEGRLDRHKMKRQMLNEKK